MTTPHYHIPGATIRVDSMPDEGRKIHLDIAAEDRDEIARQLEVSALESLTIRLEAHRLRGGIRVTGRVLSRVVQPSVVTLDPVVQDIAEDVDRVFLPGGEKAYAGQADAEIFVDLEGDDMPDHFQGNEADLTPLIIETLSLALDPYPRNPGEEVEVKGDDVADDSPFAKLSALKGAPES